MWSVWGVALPILFIGALLTIPERKHGMRPDKLVEGQALLQAQGPDFDIQVV